MELFISFLVHTAIASVGIYVGYRFAYYKSLSQMKELIDKLKQFNEKCQLDTKIIRALNEKLKEDCQNEKQN